jgi:hypothetical protein
LWSNCFNCPIFSWTIVTIVKWLLQQWGLERWKKITSEASLRWLIPHCLCLKVHSLIKLLSWESVLETIQVSSLYVYVCVFNWGLCCSLGLTVGRQGLNQKKHPKQLRKASQVSQCKGKCLT